MKISLTHTDRLGRKLGRKMTRPKVWRGEEDTIDLVETLRAGIVEDTAAGVDANGREFAPYSAAYAKETGKTQVDLKASGLMVNGLSLEVHKVDGAVVANTARAAWHTFGSTARGIPARPFMGIASDTATEALQEADRAVTTNIATSFSSKTRVRALASPRGSTRGLL